jgi:hypothetical protein
MKLKALLAALFVAGLTASYAVADDGHGHHGKAEHEGKAAAKVDAARSCRPRLELELAGTVASTSGDSFALAVSKGRAQGAQLKGEQLTLDASKARVDGTLASGAKVRVHARACIDLAGGTVSLVASRVKVAGPAGHGHDDTTSSTTTTTTTTG